MDVLAASSGELEWRYTNWGDRLGVVGCGATGGSSPREEEAEDAEDGVGGVGDTAPSASSSSDWCGLRIMCRPLPALEGCDWAGEHGLLMLPPCRPCAMTAAATSLMEQPYKLTSNVCHRPQTQAAISASGRGPHGVPWFCLPAQGGLPTFLLSSERCHMTFTSSIISCAVGWDCGSKVHSSSPTSSIDTCTHTRLRHALAAQQDIEKDCYGSQADWRACGSLDLP